MKGKFRFPSIFSRKSRSGSQGRLVQLSPSIASESTQSLIDANHGTASLPNLPATSTPGYSSSDVLQQNRAQITMERDTVPTINLPETASHVLSEDDVFDSSASPAPVTSGSASRLAYNAATQILPIVQDAAGAIPIGGSPLQAVIGGVLKVLNALDTVEQNKIKVRNLINRLNMLESAVSDEDDTRPERKQLSRTMDSLSSELRSLTDLSYARRLFENQDHAQKLSDCINKVNESILDYVFVSGLNMADDLELLHMRALLNGLLRTRSASWNSQNRTGCSENTRVDILDCLKGWSSDPNRESLFWMYGLAGTGKTTIAYSFAKFLHSKQWQCASFFCSRAHTELNNMEHIFPSLAFQLAMVNGAFRRGLLSTLEKNPNAGFLALEYQISELFVQPLEKVSVTDPPIFLVVDALDECQDDSATSRIMTLIAHHADIFSRIKILITSRPEAHIAAGFRQGSLTSLTQTFILHEVKLDVVKNDIEGFLRTRLGEIARRRRAEITVDPWPLEAQLHALVDKCGGLWIFASTVCQFVDDKYCDPQSRLELVVRASSTGDDSDEDGYGPIDRLYNEIFDLAFKGLSNAKIAANVQRLIAAIVLLFDPMSVRGMAGLLELETSDIRYRLLPPLASVIILPDDDHLNIRTFHASFHDFLTNNNRCSDSRFYVDPPINHVRLALQCLRCLSSPGTRWPAGQEILLPEVVRKGLGTHVLYSCRYWMSHLAAGISTSNEVEAALRSFFLKSLFHWMECLALLDELEIVVSSVKGAQLWLDQILGAEHHLHSLFHDSARSCFSKIGQSFLHRKGQTGRVEDADNAITSFREALACSHDNSDRLQCLESLSQAFGERFERYGPKWEDIDEAVGIHREVLRIFPSDSVKRLRYLNNLAITLAQRFERSKSDDDRTESISAFRTSSTCLSGRPIDRIHALIHFARFTHRTNDVMSASDLYVQALHNLPQLNWLRPGAVRAQLAQWDIGVTSFASDAAACMFSVAELHVERRQHYLALAIELLDQARSHWWSVYSTLGEGELHELRKYTATLAEELDRVGHALGADDLSDYRDLAEDWERIICQVRRLPLFENFLLPLPISKLRQAADGGPVVITNISSYRHDALILQSDHDLTLVTLSNQLPQALKEVIQPSNLTNPKKSFAARLVRILRGEQSTLTEKLVETWHFIGEPIVSELATLGVLQLGSSTRPRVWWYLPPDYLSRLPIHASASSDAQATGMMDLVVSSYTTALSTMLRPQYSSKFQMLVVGQPEHKGEEPLGNVTPEIAAIRNYVSTEATILEGPSATVDAVSSALSNCTWVHFACHRNEARKKMSSSLFMHGDEEISFDTIARRVPQMGGFAFFSTRQSAQEAARLLQLHGVITTMWAVEDKHALAVAKQFYTELFKNGVTAVTAVDAALALNQACRYVRDHQVVPFEHWASYVHFGGQVGSTSPDEQMES